MDYWENVMKHNSAPFREYAGAMVAVMIVLSYVVSGFVIVICGVLLGVDVKFPGDWNAAMLSLSSASLGYLIGKQVDPKPTNVPVSADFPEYAAEREYQHTEKNNAKPFQVPPAGPSDRG